MATLLHPRHGYVQGLGGLRLHYRAWEIVNPRAGIFLVHGIFEHSGRYQEFGEAMAAAGFSTFAMDTRGHGGSEGRRGHVRRFEILLQDLDRGRREVEGILPPGVPLFLVGHSLGGLIAVRYLQEYDTTLAGAIISAPWLGTALPVPRWKLALGRILDRVLPACPFPFRFDTSLLSHDPERVDDYRNDTEVHGTITPRMFREISSAIDLALERGDRIDVPIHFLLAGDDRLVDTDRSLAFVHSLPSGVATVEVMEGRYHELLQEVDRGEIMALIREWIYDRLE